jgi:Uma2 family endonuclease
MSTTIEPTVVPQPQAAIPRHWTAADLQEYLGGVPTNRIRIFPAPGTATEDDVLRIHAQEDRLCELVDGVLVEKPMATYESVLAGILVYFLNAYLGKDARGIVSTPDGTLRILPTKVRMPDVSFISLDRFPGHKLPKDRIYRVAPDLAVEILSEGNTDGEMNLRLDEYFEAGVRLVWYIDPRTRSARIYTARDQVENIDEKGVLDGRDVLPGFRLRLGELFERVPGGAA